MCIYVYTIYMCLCVCVCVAIVLITRCKNLKSKDDIYEYAKLIKKQNTHFKL